MIAAVVTSMPPEHCPAKAAPPLVSDYARKEGNVPKRKFAKNVKKFLTGRGTLRIIEDVARPKEKSEAVIYGGIAQLGERLNGIQEVCGSIPHISTKSTWNT